MPKIFTETKYLSPNEAASRLMVSPVTLRHWALAGKLDFVTTPGGHRRYAEDEVERFAAQYEKAASPDLHTRIADDDGSRRILIVDDDEQLTDFLAALLEGLPEPVTVEVANDDFEAGQKILFFRPHTILLDLIMPGLQGFELCRRIKSNADMRDIRVVVMTAYGTPENFERAMAAGADACLAKPIDKAQLFKTIMQDEAGVMAVRR